MTEASNPPVVDFDLEVSGGGRLRRDDILGRRTVLYFYPKDSTSGCTVEAKEFTAVRSELERHGVSVYGVSPDSPESHDRFVAECDLGIPLISDPEHRLIDWFKVWTSKSLYGRTYMGVERSSFLIGPDGRVEREWRAVRPAGHAAEVLAAVESGAAGA
ncbi:MAG: peroxiredoxin [Candidatus Dormibacteria bacterium]